MVRLGSGAKEECCCGPLPTEVGMCASVSGVLAGNRPLYRFGRGSVFKPPSCTWRTWLEHVLCRGREGLKSSWVEVESHGLATT